MKHCTVYVTGPHQKSTMQEFAEFFDPIYKANRADIVDYDNIGVLTFFDDEDVVVMNLKFGDRIEVVSPPAEWIKQK